MDPKPPDEERRLILLRDERRKYGVRVRFDISSTELQEFGTTELSLPDGCIARLEQEQTPPWASGQRLLATVVGFPNATKAEAAGRRLCQTLLACAIGLDLGLRFNYSSHEPPEVFDRTATAGSRASGFLTVSWPPSIFMENFLVSLRSPGVNERVALSMELFASAKLEASLRAQFVMTVSALEPLAEQQSFDSDVSSAVDRLVKSFSDDDGVPADLRQSMRGRLLELKRESVNQALKRLCQRWFENEADAQKAIRYAYSLRSELVHEGRLPDPDILLAEELRSVSYYLRRIYEKELGLTFRKTPRLD